jgi:hypothetical protein
MKKIRVCLTFYTSTFIHLLILLVCFIDYNLASLIYFIGALMLMAGKMHVNINEHISKKQTLIQMYYMIIPFVLVFKFIAVMFIWIVTPKTDIIEFPNSPSSIQIPTDDSYSVFRFIARISGVVCSYVWNSENFLKTFIMEILIYFLL